MPELIHLGIISDIHYASAAEQERGDEYEAAFVPNRFVRFLLRLYRRFIWLDQPLQKNYLLDRFLAQAPAFDYLVANGDYSCDTAYTGLSDDAAFESARQCLAKLRDRYDGRLSLVFGDHELGKLSLIGGRGGMRLESWKRAVEQLRLAPFWRLDFGRYTLLGIVSSLVALPIFEPDILAEQMTDWERLREEHLRQVRQAFAELQPEQRVLLFCHDPTALPFLWREPAIRSKLPQVQQTVVGHLHSNLILCKSRLLSGMPRITFLGHTVKRLSSALREARYWKPFHVRLCPSLAGMEVLKDGGYLSVELDPSAQRAPRFKRHRLPR
jgi:hypothetical protein